MIKLFEVYAARDLSKPENTLEDAIPALMDAVQETLEQLVKGGQFPEPQNLHIAAFHDEPCEGVATINPKLCKCKVVRFEIYNATDADVALNLAGGSTKPFPFDGADPEPIGEMN